jgi:hypothetical protein
MNNRSEDWYAKLGKYITEELDINLIYIFMKYIKPYDIINELVRNTKLISSYVDDIKKMIISINPNVKLYKKLETSTPIRLILTIYCLKENDLPELEKQLDSWKTKLQRESIILSYNKEDSCPEELRIQYHVIIKDLFTKRVKPNRFLFHFTNSDASSILDKGLLPKSSSDSKVWTVPTLAYVPAIFAVNSFNTRYKWMGKNIILIDTKGLSNKWWYDLNFDAREPLIMTYEPISAKNLRLITAEEYKEICDSEK